MNTANRKKGSAGTVGSKDTFLPSVLNVGCQCTISEVMRSETGVDMLKTYMFRFSTICISSFVFFLL